MTRRAGIARAIAVADAELHLITKVLLASSFLLTTLLALLLINP